MLAVKRLVTDSGEMTRRSLLAVVGWGAFGLATVGALWESLRFVFPNTTNEAPPIFNAGHPADYAVGSTTVLLNKRAVINRDANGFYAFNLICTHLGCTPIYFPDVTSDLIAKGIGSIRDPLTGESATVARAALPGFKCPCHGSRYFRDSVNFYGPAPRPMDHIHIELATDGRLLVDRSSFVDLAFRLKI